MALVDREPMVDAHGVTNTYRPVPDNKPGVPPEYPHPDATHEARSSGHGLHPCFHLHPLVDLLAYYEERGEEPDMPVDGDQTARWRALQCWDDQTGRQPDRKSFSGADPCEYAECPHPQPHVSGQWFSEHWPRFRDIAHALYPEGRVPWPIGFNGPRIYGPGPDREQWQPFRAVDPPAPDPEPPATPDPEQLDMLAYLEEMTS